MEKGLINGFLFLDLKKAFDTVDHKIPISKLEKYGIRGIALHLFQCYLSERKQICKLQNTMSEVVNLERERESKEHWHFCNLNVAPL